VVPTKQVKCCSYPEVVFPSFAALLMTYAMKKANIIKKMNTNRRSRMYGMITSTILRSRMAITRRRINEMVKKINPSRRAIPTGMKKNVRDHASLSSEETKQLLIDS